MAGINPKEPMLWQPWESSGVLAVGAAQVVKATPGVVGGILIYADGTNDVTVTVLNDTTTLLSTVLDTTVEGMGKAIIIGNPGVVFDTNIKVTVAGTNGTAIVLYR